MSRPPADALTASAQILADRPELDGIGITNAVQAVTG